MEIIDENKLKKVVKEVLTEYFVKNNTPSFKNPLTLYPFYALNETLLHSVSSKKAKEYICDYFKLMDHQINITNDNGIDKIHIFVYLTGIDVSMIEKAMNYLGWFLSSPKMCHILELQKKYKNGEINDIFLPLQFEPKHQNNITNELKKKERTLKHITPYYNIGKIKKIGFSPRTKNNMFDFPDRVYFVRGSVSDNDIANFAEKLNYRNENPINYGKYCVIEIDINKIPEHVKFFTDPNFDSGIYTCDNIPPNVIIDIKEIQLTDWTV